MTQPKKHYRRGDAMVVIVVILAAALVGAVGFIAWQNFIVKDDPAKETIVVDGQKSTNDEKTSEAPKDATADWLLYTSAKNKYSVRLPDGWRISNENDDWLVSRGYDGEKPNIGNNGMATSIVLKAGTKAVVSDVGGPGECYSCRFVLQQRDDFQTYGATARESAKTGQGNVIDRYQSIQDESDFGGVSGTKSYQYHIHANAGTKDIVVSYSVQPGETDIVETVDRLVETIRFED